MPGDDLQDQLADEGLGAVADASARAPPIALAATALATHGKALHVLGVRDGPGGIHLVGRGDTGIVRVPLEGAFAWRVPEGRRCVGRWEPGRDGAAWSHVPCPTSAVVTHDFVCMPCSGLEDPQCVFEPQCARDPDGCHCKAFREVPHLVYLAFHGHLPKVGMTQSWRVRARLREQGADAYFVVQAHEPGDPASPLNRAAARAVERQVAYLYKVPEWRSHRETLPQLARPVPWERIAEVAEQWSTRLSHRFDVQSNVERITDHPVPQPLPGIPSRRLPEGHHAGTWLGAKGNHLFFLDAKPGGLDIGAPPVGALRRMELVGRTILL